VTHPPWIYLAGVRCHPISFDVNLPRGIRGWGCPPFFLATLFWAALPFLFSLGAHLPVFGSDLNVIQSHAVDAVRRSDAYRPTPGSWSFLDATVSADGVPSRILATCSTPNTPPMLYIGNVAEGGWFDSGALPCHLELILWGLVVRLGSPFLGRPSCAHCPTPSPHPHPGPAPLALALALTRRAARGR